ncbi:hypothetical protein GBA52_005269 [Prunus armeniaca]|nr:hypothetical protein GBA52_005269 [Prunus armeniaca]
MMMTTTTTTMAKSMIRLAQRWFIGTSEMCEIKAEAVASKLGPEHGSLAKTEA